jgi:hypothetical protein
LAARHAAQRQEPSGFEDAGHVPDDRELTPKAVDHGAQRVEGPEASPAGAAAGVGAVPAAPPGEASRGVRPPDPDLAPFPVAWGGPLILSRVTLRGGQERAGFSIPAQQKLLRDCARASSLQIVRELGDVETAKRAGRIILVRPLDFVGLRREEFQDVVDQFQSMGTE